VTESLIVLVPLLTLAVVLLLAFTGCSLDVEGIAPNQDQQPPPGGTNGDGTNGDGPTGQPRSPTYEDLVRQGPLVAWWRLSEGGSGQTAIDSAQLPALGFDGTYHGAYDLTQAGALAPKTPGDSSAEFTVDIDSGYVEVGYSQALNPPASFSLETWVNPGAQPGTQPEVLISSRARTQNAYGFALLLDRDPADPANPRWVARLFSGASLKPTELTAPLGSPSRPDGWRHIVMTYRTAPDPAANNATNVLRLYVDAIPAIDPNDPSHDYLANVAYAAVPNTGPIPLRIASWNDNTPPDHFYSGRLDEVALYNADLTKQSIGDHFAAAT